MKKRKVGIIASSVAAIAVCSSMVVGSTFALFTSEDTVNISVSSGKVEVTASINQESVQTKELNKEFELGSDHTFGKDVVISEESATINNIACGDGIKFDIVVTNNSTIDVMYRTVISGVEDDGLFSALKVEVGAGVVYDGSTVYSTWTKMDSASEITTVTIEMPDDVGNEYQGKSCSFKFSVEAVQANANMTNGVVHIGEGENRIDYLTLQAAFDASNEGETVYVDEDITLFKGLDVTKGITLEGGNHVITITDNTNHCFYAICGGLTINNLTFNCYTTKESGLTLDGFFMYTLNNVNVYGEARHSLVRFANSSGGTMTNCTVENTIALEDTLYYNYGMPCSTDVFVNRNTKAMGATEEGGISLKLNNCKLGSLIVNGSSKSYNIPKTVVNAGTEIDFVFYASAEVPASNAIVVNEGGNVGKMYAPQVYAPNVGFYRDMLAEDEVYVITTAKGLELFAENVNKGVDYAGKTVKLGADIDLAGINWTPIGLNADDSKKFKGIFDGDEHTIFNLTVNQEPAYRAAGFFGALNGTVKNLIFVKANVTSISQKINDVTDNGTAVVAGSIYQSGYILNCNVYDSTVNGNCYVAGIAGYAYGKVENCGVYNSTIICATEDISSGKHDNGDKVGGIVGYFRAGEGDSYGVINNKVENVTVQGYRHIGGIAGYATVTNEKFYGNTAKNITIIQDLAHNYNNLDDNNGYYGYVCFVAGGTLHDSNTASGENSYTIINK